MNKLWLAILGALALLLPPAAAVAQDNSAGVVVYAAASLKNALDDVDAAFTKSSGVKVVASYAASSTLARQIEQGAPVDVFISADTDWMNDLGKMGGVKAGTYVDLLTNHLALIAPKDSKVALKPAKGFPLAKALGGGKLAMAGLDVPAGRYGKASLEALGVWSQVQGQAVYGENVRAALTFVARGEAPLGIVYDTDAMVEPAVRIVALFPESSHPKIIYPAAITAQSTAAAAPSYLAFLKGPQAKAIFAKYGFMRAGGAGVIETEVLVPGRATETRVQ